MAKSSIMIKAVLRRFGKDTRGSLSMELMLILPILLWALVGMTIFFDAYRARMQTQTAVLQVADTISRFTDVVTDDYLEGMNDVLDYMVTRNLATRIRVSAISWDSENERLTIDWSYGTRNMASLSQLAQLNLIGNIGDGSSGGGGGEGEGEAPAFDFTNDDMQLPVANLASRIPQPFPGEATILVEAFTLWRSPIFSWMGLNYLENVRFTPIAVTRPRFSPFLQYEHGDDPVPMDPIDEDPVPTPPADVDPVSFDNGPPAGKLDIVSDNDFKSGDTKDWIGPHLMTEHFNAKTGDDMYLGPYDGNSWYYPPTHTMHLPKNADLAMVEFDLLLQGNWGGYEPEGDRVGDMFVIKVEGSSIALEAFNTFTTSSREIYKRARYSTASRAEGLFATHMELVEFGDFSGQGAWQGGWGTNHAAFAPNAGYQIWRVQIAIANPVERIAMGFALTGGDAGRNGLKNFGLLNFRVSAGQVGNILGHFVPDSKAQLQSKDYATEYNRFSGCPDQRIAGQNLTLRSSDLYTGEVTFTRFLDMWVDQIDLSQCTDVKASGIILANPMLVMRYTNDTSNVGNTRLKLTIFDMTNNPGYCDATILVRDPFGQFTFVEPPRIGDGKTSLLLGHAASGNYHLWVGLPQKSYCHAEIVLEHY